MLEYALAAEFLVAFITTLLVTPHVIKMCKKHGFMGTDRHKPVKREAAELGGIGILLGFIFGIFALIGVSTFVMEINIGLVALFAAICSVLIVFIIGVIDDLFKIRWRTKFLLPIVAAVPLMAVKAGTSFMVFPFFGGLELGLLYVFVLIPFGVTGAANAVNMIAGYNGIEAGMGILMVATLAIIAFDAGQLSSLVLLLAMLGALIAFMKYNWYPARIFPGDTGTLQIGALLAAAAIIGNMEKYAVALLLLHFINLVIFLWGMKIKKAKLVKFASVDKRGVLQAPEGFWKYYLPYALIKFLKPKEKQLVRFFFIAQGIICIIVLGVYFTGL